MSARETLLLRLLEVKRAMVTALPAAKSAMEYAEEDRHEQTIWLDCRGVLQRLEEAEFNLDQALRHLEEEDHHA